TWKCNYYSKYKLLNTFSHQQLEQSCDFYKCPAEYWLQLVKPLTSAWRVLIGPVLITCTLPRKKELSSNTHQTEHMQLAPEPLFYQEIYSRH
ncbi:unnamed protein product, partial [Staurois parvus]